MPCLDYALLTRADGETYHQVPLSESEVNSHFGVTWPVTIQGAWAKGVSPPGSFQSIRIEEVVDNLLILMTVSSLFTLLRPNGMKI